MMVALDTSRMFAASQAVGLAQGAIDQAITYSKQRIQFNRPISAFQAIQFMIADMVAAVESARLLTYQAARHMDRKKMHLVPRFCAMAKFVASDTAMSVTTDAIQVMGGYGYMKDYPLERFFNDTATTEIYTGTNQIMRVVTARELLKD
jgi:alkylation response protein AidB-like acyl-CoA dehydrogenase